MVLQVFGGSSWPPPISQCGLVHAELNGVVQDHRVHILLPIFCSWSCVFFLGVSRNLQKHFVLLIGTWRFSGTWRLNVKGLLIASAGWPEIFVKLKHMLSCSWNKYHAQLSLALSPAWDFSASACSYAVGARWWRMTLEGTRAGGMNRWWWCVLAGGMGHDDVVIRFRSKLVKHKVVQADNHGHPVEAKKTHQLFLNVILCDPIDP
jgi:hypothetical protein